MKLGKIADHLGCTVPAGNADKQICRVASLQSADESCLTFVVGDKYLDAARQCRAGVVLVTPGTRIENKTCLEVANPYLAYALVAQLFENCQPVFGPGIAPSAVIDGSACIGSGTAVGPGAVIGPRVEVGENTEVSANCVVEADCRIGNNCRIDAGVVIRRECTLGNRVIIQANSVIGSEGFGNARDGERWIRIPCFGGVEIGDDAEIGSNVTIDRGNFEPTIIGEGARIDNLVQIAHNCSIGPHAAIAAQAGLAGSTIVGRGAIIAGQAGFAGHLTVGAGAFVGAQAGVSKSVEPGAKVTGYPARDIIKTRRIDAAMQQLPELIKTVRALKRARSNDGIKQE